MSHDGLFTLANATGERYFYSRWGALQIDRILLSGPEAAIGHIAGLEETREPTLGGWLCGAVRIDVEQRTLLYWADQLFGGSPVTHHYFRRVLARAWPGWQCRWATRGGVDVTEALGRPPPEPQAMVAPISAPELRAWIDEPWQSFRDANDGDALVAQYGETVVRSWAELDSSAWVTVRWADGRLGDHLVRWTDHDVPAFGPALLEALRDRRPIRAIDLEYLERDVVQATLIDEAARELHHWRIYPRWRPPAWHAGWPGWLIDVHDGGPRRHAELAGYPAGAVRCPEEDTRHLVDAALARCMEPINPAALLGVVAARLAEQHPNAQVVIHGAPRGPARDLGTAADNVRQWFAEALADDE